MGRPETGQPSALGLEERKLPLLWDRSMLSELILAENVGLFSTDQMKGLTGGFLILPKKTAWIGDMSVG